MKIQKSKLKVQNSNPPSPSPSPARGEGSNISPPLRGGDEGEGDVCGFTNDRISKRGCRRQGRYFKGKMGGFTLIELVMTMVLIGIIAYIVATALTTGIKAYFMTDFRKEALDQSRIAMERMTREIRNVRSSSDIWASSDATRFCFTNTDGTTVSFRYPGNTVVREEGLANLAACPGAAGNTLATSITPFLFQYIDNTGAVGAFSAATTKRIRITITATKNTESVTLQSEVWPRNL